MPAYSQADLSAEVKNLGDLSRCRAVMLRRPTESNGQRQHDGKRNPETSSFCAAQDRVWVDGFTFPVFLRIVGDQDRKMQMIIAGARVAGVTDITDDIALSHVVTHAEAGGIAV